EETVLQVLDYEGAALNVLSEEAGYIERGGKATLVLDPIDGTHNAIRGVPAYSVSLAIGHERLSDVQEALVRDLVSGATYYAAKGGGLVLDLKGNELDMPLTSTARTDLAAVGDRRTWEALA